MLTHVLMSPINVYMSDNRLGLRCIAEYGQEYGMSNRILNVLGVIQGATNQCCCWLGYSYGRPTIIKNHIRLCTPKELMNPLDPKPPVLKNDSRYR